MQRCTKKAVKDEFSPKLIFMMGGDQTNGTHLFLILKQKTSSLVLRISNKLKALYILRSLNLDVVLFGSSGTNSLEVSRQVRSSKWCLWSSRPLIFHTLKKPVDSDAPPAMLHQCFHLMEEKLSVRAFLIGAAHVSPIPVIYEHPAS